MLPKYSGVLAFALMIAFGLAALSAEQEYTVGQDSQPSALKLIGARCIFCHSPPLTLAFSVRILDAGGSNALDAFLAKHHAPDAKAREIIVRFLAQPVVPSEER